MASGHLLELCQQVFGYYEDKDGEDEQDEFSIFNTIFGLVQDRESTEP